MMVNEEIANKTVSMAIHGGKDGLRNILKELKKLMDTAQKSGGLQNYVDSRSSEIKMKDMAKKGQLEEIGVKGQELKELKKELNRNGVKFSIMRDKESGNYTVFFQAKDLGIMEKAFKNALHTSEKKAERKESVKKKIDKFKEMIKENAGQDKDRHKRREQSL